VAFCGRGLLRPWPSAAVAFCGRGLLRPWPSAEPFELSPARASPSSPASKPPLPDSLPLPAALGPVHLLTALPRAGRLLVVALEPRSPSAATSPAAPMRAPIPRGQPRPDAETITTTTTRSRHPHGPGRHVTENRRTATYARRYLPRRRGPRGGCGCPTGACARRSAGRRGRRDPSPPPCAHPRRPTLHDSSSHPPGPRTFSACAPRTPRRLHPSLPRRSPDGRPPGAALALAGMGRRRARAAGRRSAAVAARASPAPPRCHPCPWVRPPAWCGSGGRCRRGAAAGVWWARRRRRGGGGPGGVAPAAPAVSVCGTCVLCARHPRRASVAAARSCAHETRRWVRVSGHLPAVIAAAPLARQAAMATGTTERAGRHGYGHPKSDRESSRRPRRARWALTGKAQVTLQDSLPGTAGMGKHTRCEPTATKAQHCPPKNLSSQLSRTSVELWQRRYPASLPLPRAAESREGRRCGLSWAKSVLYSM